MQSWPTYPLNATINSTQSTIFEAIYKKPVFMKKKIITYFILLVFCLPIAAQNFRVGVTAGANLHSSTNIDARMGFSIGAKGEYGFNSLDEGWYAE